MDNFEIITCPIKFKSITSIESPDDSIAFETFWRVHDFFVKETWVQIKAREFLEAIWKVMDMTWEWNSKPTSNNDIISSHPWRGQDSLSLYLLWIKWITREQYQRIMAYSNKWYLDQFYIKISGRLNSASS